MLTIATATLVATGRFTPVGWIYIALVNTPLNVVAFSLFPTAWPGDWPDVAFLPGVVGSWDKFLFPFLYFAGFCSAFWFFLGWIFGRLTHFLRYGS